MPDRRNGQSQGRRDRRLDCRHDREFHCALYRSALRPDCAGGDPSGDSGRSAMGSVRHGRRTEARMRGYDAARVPSSLPTSVGRTFALRRGRAQWAVLTLWAVFLLALPNFLPVFWIHLANFCLIAVMGAVALNILTGNARLVSLGQAAFLGIGAFTAGLLDRAYGIPFLVGLVAAGITGALVGLVVALLS